MKQSFLKINEKLAGALSYVAGPATGLIFYVGETATGNNNQFVKFHALQSTIFLGGVIALQIILGVIRFVPFIGLIRWLVDFVSFIAYVFLIYSAYTGKTFRIPVIGDACYNTVYSK